MRGRSLLEAIAGLGVRPRKELLRRVIAQLCAGHWRTAARLADQLTMEASNFSDRHLAPMLRDGTLERRYPEMPTHPEQAYRTACMQGSLVPQQTLRNRAGGADGGSPRVYRAHW